MRLSESVLFTTRFIRLGRIRLRHRVHRGFFLLLFAETPKSNKPKPFGEKQHMLFGEADKFIRIPISGILIKSFLCDLRGSVVKSFLDKSDISSQL